MVGRGRHAAWFVLLGSLVYLSPLQAQGLFRAGDTAQGARKVAYQSLREAVRDPEHPFYYPWLLRRYQSGDTTLQAAAYHHLYYGYIYAPGYQPYQVSTQGFRRLAHPTSADQERGVALCREILRAHPFDLDALWWLAQHPEGVEQSEYRAWLRHFHFLIATIRASGQGQSRQDPVYITYPRHARFLLQYLGIPVLQELPMTGRCESYEVLYRGELDTMYFNIEGPMEHQVRRMNPEEGPR